MEEVGQPADEDDREDDDWYHAPVQLGAVVHLGEQQRRIHVESRSSPRQSASASAAGSIATTPVGVCARLRAAVHSAAWAADANSSATRPSLFLRAALLLWASPSTATRSRDR